MRASWRWAMGGGALAMVIAACASPPTDAQAIGLSDTCGLAIDEAPASRPLDPCNQGALVFGPDAGADGAAFDLDRPGTVCVRAESSGTTSAARVGVDGMQVLGPSDFAATVPAAEGRVELPAGRHTLSVWAPGRARSLPITVRWAPALTAETIASGAHLSARALYHTPAVLVPELGGAERHVDFGVDAGVSRTPGLPAGFGFGIRYRFEVRDAASCAVVAALAGEAAVAGGTQSLRVRWDGRDSAGAIVAAGSYLYRAQLDLIRVDSGGSYHSTVETVTTPAHVLLVQAASAPPIRADVSGLRLELDRIVYRAADALSAALVLQAGTFTATEATVIVVSTETQDVELIELRRAGPDRWATVAPISVEVGVGDRRVLDGRLQAGPGEFLLATFYPDYASHPEIAGRTDMVTDWAVIGLDEGLPPPPEVLPALAWTDDDLAGSTPGASPVATLFTSPGLPVQILTGELIFFPEPERDLATFLSRTGGTVVGRWPTSPASPAESYLVRVDASAARVAALPQYQHLVGSTERLYASAPEGHRIVAYAEELMLDGYTVALHPRLQFASPPRFQEAPPCTPAAAGDCLLPGPANRGELTSRAFRVLPDTFAYAALFDIDERRVRVAFMDDGFSPNPDFGPLAAECSVPVLGGIACGPGQATAPPGVEGSYHGNFTVTSAGAVPNNGFGNAGVGGQVVSPMLYQGDSIHRAFNIANAIDDAVARGASVINISAGFPCRIVTTLGLSLGICNQSERISTCSFVASLVASAALAACATLSFDPILGSIVCNVAAATVATVTGACLTAFGLPLDFRGPMRSAIADATDAGVPVVVSAGNRIDPEEIPEGIRDLADLEEDRSEAWDVIPCTFPDTICVGQAEKNEDELHRNVEFRGDAVDMWAPSATQYHGPSDINDVTSRQIRVATGGGSSGAAAYLSGTIALLMATDRDLDRAFTTRPPGDLRSDIVALLQGSGTAPTAATPGRGILVNPFELIRGALRDTLGEGVTRYPVVPFGGTDVEGDYDLREADPGPDPNDSAPGDSMDGPPFFRSGSVVAIPGGGTAPASVDADWYHTDVPPVSGMYAIDVTLRSPVGAGSVFDSPSIVGPAFTLVSELTAMGGGVAFPPGGELVRVYHAEVVDGTRAEFRVEAASDGTGDNHYTLTHTVTRIGDRGGPDRFDDVNPRNAPESTPNNNVFARAVILGERTDAFASELNWVMTETLLSVESTVAITGLNMSSSAASDGSLGADPADYFEILRAPSHPLYGPCDACQNRLLIVDVPLTVSVTFHAACNGGTSETRLRELSEGVLDLGDPLRTLGPGRCVGVRLTPNVPAGTVVESYDVSVTYQTDGALCARGPECF